MQLYFFNMTYLLVFQIFIGFLFLKFYAYFPKLNNRENKVIYSGGYFFAISLIGYAIFSPHPILEEINFIIFPLCAFIIGAIDDKIDINPWLRLLIFSILILLLITIENKFQINFINFNNTIYKINFPVDIFFTCLCFLLLINAMNFADGINCLAGIIFLFFFTFLGFRLGIKFELITIISISIIFFLVLNWKNISHMGDGGVYLLAFLFAQLLIISFKENYQNFLADEIFLILYLPGFDLFRIFVDRLFRKKNPFKVDKTHLHHLLNKKIGLQKTLVMYMACLVAPLVLYSFFLINNFICLFMCIIIYSLLFSYAKN